MYFPSEAAPARLLGLWSHTVGWNLNLHAGFVGKPLVQFLIQPEVTVCSPLQSFTARAAEMAHVRELDRLHGVRIMWHTAAWKIHELACEALHPFGPFLLGSQLGECINQGGRARHEYQTEPQSILLWFTRATEGRTQGRHNSTHTLICNFDLPAGRAGSGKRGKKGKRCKSKMVYFVKGAVGDEKTWCATKWYIQMYMAFKRYYSCHSNVSSQ